MNVPTAALIGLLAYVARDRRRLVLPRPDGTVDFVANDE